MIVLISVSCSTTRRAKNSVSNKEVRKISISGSEARDAKEVSGDSLNSLSGISSEDLLHPLVNPIINTALTYAGTRYKFGGTSKKGMDCSGLVYVSFLEHNIPLQRASYMMAQQGIAIKLGEIRKGDLLFFGTGRRHKRINHVGLVVETYKGDIKFIHATSSRGVTISSLKDGYWGAAFIKAKRIL